MNSPPRRATAIPIMRLDATERHAAQLATFLRDLDHHFHPPLGVRFDIDAYARKVLTSAVVLAAAPGEEGFEGIAIFYCTPSEFAYSFMSYIASRQRLAGVGSALLAEVIRYSREAGSKGVEMQTWESNQASQALFCKFGFQKTGTADNRGISEKSVLYRLVF